MANLAFLLIFSVQSQASENIARVVGGHAGEQSKILFSYNHSRCILIFVLKADGGFWSPCLSIGKQDSKYQDYHKM